MVEVTLKTASQEYKAKLAPASVARYKQAEKARRGRLNTMLEKNIVSVLDIDADTFAKWMKEKAEICLIFDDAAPDLEFYKDSTFEFSELDNAEMLFFYQFKAQ